jgi:hypothetical protein
MIVQLSMDSPVSTGVQVLHIPGKENRPPSRAGYKIRLLALALRFPLKESGSGDQASPLAKGLTNVGFSAMVSALALFITGKLFALVAQWGTIPQRIIDLSFPRKIVFQG